MNPVEFKPEGEARVIINAFPRQTTPEVTPPVTPVTVEKTPEKGEEKTPEPTPVVEPVPPVTPPAQPVVPTAPEAKPEPDYKLKFSESTRRNQIVESQFKELQKILGDITQQEVPTDEEMMVKFSDWEYLSDREKNAERRLAILEARENKRTLEMKRLEQERETLTKLDEYISTEPRLKGKENEFYEFATRPNNQGASVEVLLNAFLFETTPITAVETVVPPVETPPALERGNPSGDMPPETRKDGQMSDEELTRLRTTDHKKYNDMVRRGLIK